MPDLKVRLRARRNQRPPIPCVPCIPWPCTTWPCIPCIPCIPWPWPWPWPCPCIPWPWRSAAGLAAMVVLRAELLEERDRGGERLDALNGAVGHVGGRLAGAVEGLHVGAARHEELDRLVVAARRGVVERGVAFVVAAVDVG